MADESKVIREFLVSLGFVINQPSEKKFTGTLEKTTKLAMQTGKAVLTVGTAAQVMVALFTSNMEKMYYASRRTGATVGNLQAAEFGFKNIGIEAGAATASLEAMAAAVRMNPGLRGLMNNILGKDTSKMDSMEAMVELVQKLSRLPHNVGAGIIGNFGIDEKTFLMMKQGLPEMLAAIEKRKAMAAAAGVDPDAAAKASKEYQNLWRGVLEKVDLLQAKLSIALLEPAREFAKLINATLDRIIAFDPKPVKEEAKSVEQWVRGDLSDPNKAAPKNALKPGGNFGGSMSDLWKFLKGERGLTTDAGAGRGTVTPPTVTDADRSVAPGKIDLRNMTKEENARVMALAAKQFGPALRNRGRWTGGMTTQHAENAPTAAEEQRSIIQKELDGETDAKRRAALQRELGRIGAPTAPATAPAGGAGTGTKVEIVQTNNIKVDGGGNATDVDTRLQGVLNRVNADVIRNFKGATR